MPLINPADPDLRRLHAVNEEILGQYKARLGTGEPIDAIIIVKYMTPEGKERLIVTDGTHRTQAALELGLAQIEYRTATAAQAAREAAGMHLSFDDLAQRAVPFGKGKYSF